MRITNSIILRGYNRDLNRLMTQKNACEKRITSTRKFSRASEAPLSAAKALNVRKSLYYSEQYMENLKTANKFYTEAETSLLQVSDKMATIRETLIAACNTTKDQEEYSIYGEQLEMIAKELVSIFNTDSAGRAIFGGESDDSMPFGLIEDSTGHIQTVTYHGVPVNAMNDPKAFPYSTPVTVDVGLGMDMDQKTQEVNPQSVLDISFNGAKITGCGADKGTADIDLSSIKNDRKYCFDVYAGSIKKTIEFTGKSTFKDNVAEINRALEVAFSKEVTYDKVKQPTMDERGVIYSEGSIVNAVSNTTKGAEKLVIDNDSGYTDKFKLNFAAFESGKEYAIDVTVGGITKSIKFVADGDPDPETREANTIDLVQKELDKVFGKDDDDNSVCFVSTNPVTKGCFSAEGQLVTVQDSMKMTGDGITQRGAHVDSQPYDQIDLVKLNAGNEYTIRVDGGNPVTFVAGKTISETITAIQGVVAPYTVAGPFGDKQSIRLENGDDFAKLGEVENAPVGVIAIKPTSGAKYTVNLNDLNEDQEYCLKVVYNNRAKLVTFKGSADPEKAQKAIQGALADAFGMSGIHNKIGIDEDGVVTAYDGNPVSVTTINQGTADDPPAVQRDVIYSNNYLQLTIDAARALRAGDIDYANGCIDKIVMANEHLLVQIADLGCNEDFIDFNIEKLTTRQLNLYERQNDLEITDAEKEITLWKTYEALYNACLQMSSSVVPNSIFNYIR